MEFELYHKPDDRWEIFGCPNLETYLARYLVKGKFHAKVPQDVLEAYTTIEYLIAHAYYYYPMYDEALSKLLRTMEMVVKLKCGQLNIPLEEEYTDRNNNVKKNKKDFNRLIQDLVTAEPDKKSKYSLEIIRQLRNIYMHPDKNYFAGGMLRTAIISCITVINIIFSEEAVCRQINEKIQLYNDLLHPFKNKALVIQKESKAYLIHQMKIVDVFIQEQNEIVSLFIQPVMVVNADNTKENIFTQPLAFDVKNISSMSNEISGVDMNDGESLIICLSDNLQDIKAYEDYKTYIDKVNFVGYNHYDAFINSEENHVRGEFRYKYYHLM